MLFEKEGLRVRELLQRDKLLLVNWLSNPVVLEYYEGRDNSFDLEKVDDKFYNCNDDVSRCIIEFEGKDLGYIQYYRFDEMTSKIDDYSEKEIIYGIDQFIGEPDYWNRGIGTLLVKSMVEYLIEQKQADRVVMDPQVQNERALKCYEKCGFNKVRILPEHEFHEGKYRDCWLIEYKNP
ncbi:GNAT family N-acetyltransferase [Virgibacillus dakarensis]|uniref:GNAT family N-acetyltransferase n=1 Tax=Virgibacillus dakarensis TaxID=1917889 RepID=UPI000B450D41|nr:GNAT family N-acetyltransferase [Virgibacillus dakarensis]MTW84539.1 GNAT family N-acetyltransferase [Virgibacillus dakarensis]